MAIPPRVTSSRPQKITGATRSGKARPAQGLEDNMDLWVSTKGQRRKISDKILKLDVGISLERSIAVGSTLSIITRDPERLLQKSGFYTKENQSDFELDDLWFRCCHFDKNGDEYTLEAEDREIAMMRLFKGPYKQSASQRVNPRALYIRSLVKKAVPHAIFFCPELDIKPKVLPAKETEHQKKAKFKKGAHTIMIGGQAADPDQKSNIETVLAVCDAKSAPMNVRIAIICAGLTESTFHTHDPANDGSGSDGVFQTKSSWDSKLNKFDTKQVAAYWLDNGFYTGPHGGGGGIKLGSKGIPPGVIAQEVEGSAFPERYEEHRKEAEAIIAIVGSGEATPSSAAEREYTPQRFFQLPLSEEKEGGQKEGAWENSSAYAEEVLWRLFCSSGQINFVSDEYLEKQKPAMQIDEGSPGVDNIKWEVDEREEKSPPKLEIEGHASLWQAPPGHSVIIGERQGKEIHEGIWLVSTIQRPDIFDSPVTITLERPKNALAERALAKVKVSKEEAVTSSTSGSPGGNTTPDGGINAGIAEDVNQRALQVHYNAGWIASQKIPYVYGGGHGPTFGPTPGNPLTKSLSEQVKNSGLDCSGAVSWAIGAGKAGLLSAPEDTTELEHWGIAGVGKFFTVWVRSVPDGHTFLEFTLPGKPKEIFVAHRPGTIVGFGSESHDPSTGNWKPRHWPQL